MNILLDIDIVLDICAQRKPHAETSALAIEAAKSRGAKLWLYCGSTQTLEYNLYKLLKHENQTSSTPLSNKSLLLKARVLLSEFVRGINWLSALAGEGAVFDSPDPESEQLIRAMDRFPSGSIKLLTRDVQLLNAYPEKTISPEAYCSQVTTPSKMDFIDLKTQQDHLRPQLEKNIHRVLHHGKYIMGPEIAELESKLAEYVGVKHAITVASGTASLEIAMMALGIGPGDEVITTPFTFIATGEMIALLGATPVFVDIDPVTYNIDPSQIEAAITPNTRAIIAVSLYGQPADFDAINAIAERHGLPVIEDGAQSFGATYKGRRSCGLSTIGSTSFFPSKPLGGYGDGGALFTNDDALAKAMREIRVHGQDRRYHHPRIGVNGRMDTLQAAIVLAKLERFDQEIIQRQQVAERYNQLLAMDEYGPRLGEQDIGVHPRSSEANTITLPSVMPECTSVWAQYTIQVEDRDALCKALNEQGIPTAVHYPLPLHQQPAFASNCSVHGDLPVAESAARRVMSLPMHPDLTESEQKKIVNALKAQIK